METTSFIENVVQLVEQRYQIKIDFSIFQRNDPKIIEAISMWHSYLNRKADIMFQEACLFAYYKPEFLAEYLKYEVYNEPLYKTNNTLWSVGMTLLPPSVNNVYFNFSIVNEKTLRCGLSYIDYPGLIDSMEGKPFQDFSDFISRASNTCSSENITSLIKCGATDCFGHTRKAMLESFENFTTDKSKTIEILHNEEFSKKELGLMEFEELDWAYSSSWFFDEETGELHYIGKEQ